MAEGSATAKRRYETWLQRFWPWFVPPACFLALLGVRSVWQAFKIPSGGMYPTLVILDHVFVSKLAYGVFENAVPARGDVIVFEYPLGDNRNNSYDSRAWRSGKGGGVPLDHIEGRVSFVWWSPSLSSRFGLSIHGKPTLPPLDPSPQAALDACLAKRPPIEKTRPPPPKDAR